MQPCGRPVFRMRVGEVSLSSLTCWGLQVRKSSIQLRREGSLRSEVTEFGDQWC